MAPLELGDCHKHLWLSEASPGHFAPPQELEQLLLLTFSPSFRHCLSIWPPTGFGKQPDHEDQELQLPSNAEINYRQKVSSFRGFSCQCRIGTARFLSLPQHWVLQSTAWSADPEHCLPPQEGAGLSQSLVFLWLPPPQEALHEPSLDQTPQPPSTAAQRNFC